jgi:hypothetical protein
MPTMDESPVFERDHLLVPFVLFVVKSKALPRNRETGVMTVRALLNRARWE